MKLEDVQKRNDFKVCSMSFRTKKVTRDYIKDKKINIALLVEKAVEEFKQAEKKLKGE